MEPKNSFRSLATEPKKLFSMGFEILWLGKGYKKLFSMGFEILGLGKRYHLAIEGMYECGKNGMQKVIKRLNSGAEHP